jgi:hypothetical protein
MYLTVVPKRSRRPPTYYRPTKQYSTVTPCAVYVTWGDAVLLPDSREGN